MSAFSACRDILDLEGNELRERSIAAWSALAGISMLEDLPGCHDRSAERLILQLQPNVPARTGRLSLERSPLLKKEKELLKNKEENRVAIFSSSPGYFILMPGISGALKFQVFSGVLK